MFEQVPNRAMHVVNKQHSRGGKVERWRDKKNRGKELWKQAGEVKTNTERQDDETKRQIDTKDDETKRQNAET